jgi:hypothetical protein
MTFTNLENERNSAILRTSYTAFLLRCWLEEMDGEPAWRFTLVQMGDKGSMHGFASLEDLTAHLRLALAERARPPERTEFRSQQKQGDPK